MKKKIFKSLIISFILSILLFSLILYKQNKQQKEFVSPDFICKDCNVILITMTNLRYDHMSSSGYFRPTTPNLDKLAKESLVFDNAFAHSSWTLPEGISIYTGLYPYQHGVMNRDDGSKLSANIPTLVDILNSNGYKTAAFTGGFDYNEKFGLTSRFSYYKKCMTEPKVYYVNTQNGQKQKVIDEISEYGQFDCTIPNALTWLQTNQHSKFFLHVQGYDAHCPFGQKGAYLYDKNYRGTIDYTSCLWTFDRSEPVIEDGKTYYPVYSPRTGTNSHILLGAEDIFHLIALYDEDIKFADEQIGLFLNGVSEMGLNNNTIIIFTSEHGDMFGKHGRFMRGGPLRGTFYDDVLHIPLIIKHPKITAKRINGFVQHIDLAGTMLDFLGIKDQFHTEGKNLIPLIFENKEINSYVFAGSEFNPRPNNIYFSKKTRVDAVRSKQWKLIEETIFDKSPPSKTIELYDIINDKEELNNLADKDEDILKDLQSKLNAWSKKVNER